MLQIIVLQLPLVRGGLEVTDKVLLDVDVEALPLAGQPDSLPEGLSRPHPPYPPVVTALTQLAAIQVLQNNQNYLNPSACDKVLINADIEKMVLM